VLRRDEQEFAAMREELTTLAERVALLEDEMHSRRAYGTAADLCVYPILHDDYQPNDPLHKQLIQT
jgi:hypothetical protein